MPNSVGLENIYEIVKHQNASGLKTAYGKLKLESKTKLGLGNTTVVAGKSSGEK